MYASEMFIIYFINIQITSVYKGMLVENVVQSFVNVYNFIEGRGMNESTNTIIYFGHCSHTLYT